MIGGLSLLLSGKVVVLCWMVLQWFLQMGHCKYFDC